jgi:hypothetical protein
LSESTIKVRNAHQALIVAVSYLKGHSAVNAPPEVATWQEKTLYAPGIEDYAVTSKLFTYGDWMVEIYQGVAPVSNTVYQVTIFNPEIRASWKGRVRADGTVIEISPLIELPETESSKIAEEFTRKTRVPPPRPGGYGH